MHYLIEASNGVRSRITEEQANIARGMSDVLETQLTSFTVLFRLKGQRAPAPKPLKWGGRTQQEAYNL